MGVVLHYDLLSIVHCSQIQPLWLALDKLDQDTYKNKARIFGQGEDEYRTRTRT